MSFSCRLCSSAQGERAALNKVWQSNSSFNIQTLVAQCASTSAMESCNPGHPKMSFQPDIVCGLVRALVYRRCYYIILTKQRRVSGQEGTTIHFEKVLHKLSSMDISGYLSCMHFCNLCNKHNYLCCRISWLVTRVFYLCLETFYV